MKYTKQVLFRVTERQYEVLAGLAEAEDKSIAQLLRDAINEKASREPWKPTEKRGSHVTVTAENNEEMMQEINAALARSHNRGVRRG